MTDEQTFAGTEDERRERASSPILAALNKAKRDFESWQDNCDLIDDIYSRDGEMYQGLMKLYGGESVWRDNDLDLFWSSFEVMKPAVYARPPRPAVKPLFSDNDPLKNLTAELLERVSISTFSRTGINDVMCHVRDDVLFAGRGVMWLRYETDDGQKVCVEHLDRKDFLHEPVRKWTDVGWVAGGFWLTREEMGKRFAKLDADTLDQAKYALKRDEHASDDQALTRKCQVWEVWHRADNKVYWVTEGIDVLLDSGAPHLKLSGFFPCPRPAYATLKRRSLVPVPDWNRYAIHFRKISDLTGRIYLLLDSIKMKGLVAGGGDIADAVQNVLADESDQVVIAVPGAALLANGSAPLVVWLPLAELATAITGLIEARGQLIEDFYQLSGISDIMRGATEAEETLGAQQLKSQYGSVRVRDKIDELQRIAADAVKIAAEIEAEHFSQKTLLDMSQMQIPTKADIKKRIEELNKAAEEELSSLGEQAQQAASQTQGETDPAQAQAALQQAQQQLLAKYAPMLREAQESIPVEDVMKLLRDDRARSFAFEVESDSTILTDEMQEKASRNEFMAQFSTSIQSLMGLAGMGEQGAQLSGEMLKFVLAPYRAGRSLDGAIDAFIEAAPQMAQIAQGQEGDTEALVEANNKLAEAEMQKAQAAIAKVQADSQLKQAELQRKMLELQQKAQNDNMRQAAEGEKLRQSLADAEAKLAKTDAEIDKLRAETAQILAKIGLDVRQQDLAEYQAAEQSQQQQVDNAMAAQGQATDTQFREREAERADRGEQRADRGEDRAARAQTFAEQQEPKR